MPWKSFIWWEEVDSRPRFSLSLRAGFIYGYGPNE